MSDFTTAILDQLASLCPECDVTNGTIARECFTCFSEPYVMYRARLNETSLVDSLHFVSLIEDWVEGGGASISVTGVELTVDPQCPVVISSLSEGGCSPTTQSTPQPSTPPPLTDDTTIPNSVFMNDIVLAIIAALIGLVIAIIIITVIVGFSLKRFRNHHSK